MLEYNGFSPWEHNGIEAREMNNAKISCESRGHANRKLENARQALA